MCFMYTLVQECHNGVPAVVEQTARAEGISPNDLARACCKGPGGDPFEPEAEPPCMCGGRRVPCQGQCKCRHIRRTL